MTDIVTDDFSDFGSSERMELLMILQAWNKYGLPVGFEKDGVKPFLNKNSGCVFLSNSECEVCMLNCSIATGGTLEIWHKCPNCGHEGFEEDCELNDDGCNECYPQEKREDSL